MTNLKEDDDGFMVLASWYGDVDSPRWVNSVTDGQTDRRTGIVPALRAGIIHIDKQWELYRLYL